VEQRERGVGVLCNVRDGEVIADKGGDQTAHRSGDHHKLSGNSRCDRGYPSIPAQCRACNPEERLQQRQQHGENQGEMPELRQHQAPPGAGVWASGTAGFSACRFFRDLATSGGMYFSSCLASTSSATKVLPVILPCAT